MTHAIRQCGQSTAEYGRYKEVIRQKLAQAYADAYNDPDVQQYLGIYDGKDAASALVGSFQRILDEVCAPPTQHHVRLGAQQVVDLLLSEPGSPEWVRARDHFAPVDRQ